MMVHLICCRHDDDDIVQSPWIVLLFQFFTIMQPISSKSKQPGFGYFKDLASCSTSACFTTTNNPVDISTLESLYELLDREKKGFLTKSELKQGFTCLVGYKPPRVCDLMMMMMISRSVRD